MMRQRGDLSRYVDAALTSMDLATVEVESVMPGRSPGVDSRNLRPSQRARPVRRQAEGSHCDDTPGQRTSQMAGT